MKIGIIGAGGRMGQASIRQVMQTPGCTVAAASDAPGSPAVGRDAGEVAGVGALGLEVAGNAASVFAASEAVIEFTLPGRQLRTLRSLRRQAFPISSERQGWMRRRKKCCVRRARTRW